MELIVSKFGGSSVKDASSMMLCADIVKKLKTPSIVVISATWNTSNLLEDIKRASIKGDHDYLGHQFQILRDRHDMIARDLNIYGQVKNDLLKLYNEARSYSKEVILKQDFSPRLMDSLYSIGERLSSVIFTGCLKKTLGNSFNPINIDIRDFLLTDSNFGKATPDFYKMKELVDTNLLPLLTGKNIIITQGFIGKDIDGNTTTLGREGSDYTGSILASMVHAKEYRIWTDVNGVKICDPKLVKDAMTINELSYEDAELFAKHGAKVLFSKTMGPVKDSKIPIFVGSTKDSDGAGTWIKGSVYQERAIIGFTVLKVEKCQLSVIGRKASHIDLSKSFKELELISKASKCVKYNINGDLNYNKLYDELTEVDLNT